MNFGQPPDEQRGVSARNLPRRHGKGEVTERSWVPGGRTPLTYEKFSISDLSRLGPVSDSLDSPTVLVQNRNERCCSIGGDRTCGIAANGFDSTRQTGNAELGKGLSTYDPT